MRLRRLTSPSRSRIGAVGGGGWPGQVGMGVADGGMIFLGPSRGTFRLASTTIAASLVCGAGVERSAWEVVEAGVAELFEARIISG